MSDLTVKPLEASLDDFSQLHYWDGVIIGAGPAGLPAGLTTAHRALTPLVIEAKDQPGGQPQFLYSDRRIAATTKTGGSPSWAIRHWMPH